MAHRLPSDRSATTQAVVDARLRRATGAVDVWVALDQGSLARTRALLAQTTGIGRVRALSSAQGEGRAQAREAASIAAAMKGQQASILAQQSAMAADLRALGAIELGRVSVAHNAIAITVDAARISVIARLPGVRSVRPVVHYELHLGETVPYIGATAVQTLGFDGSGVRVAVLDSGIDYTHKNLGGAGTAAAYAAAYGAAPGDPLQTTRDGLFPTAKVVDGFDFVGEGWPATARTEDPDPIDFEGHGTHVADIIAGSDGGTHKGVAPGASLVAVKVCSAVASSCNGIALLKGMDFALDPNGDADLSDAVDVINMSLGSSYGQIEDDLSGATANAVALGVTVVVSAGNSANKPYVVGSPSSTPGAISVAQTQVPSASAPLLQVTAPAGIAGDLPAVFQPWSVAPGGVITAPVQYGNGAAGNLNGCAAFAAGSLASMIVLVDRGACNFTLKIKNIGDAGGLAGIIGLINADDPFAGGDGGDRPITIPGYMISQANAIRLRSGLPGTTVRIDPAAILPLVGSIVGSSSRGPSISFSHIKPEIGAPGASVSAIAGSGTGQGPFGGTSGAAPMVSGAAALLLSANPSLNPMQVKALLMNSAETQILTDPSTLPGVLAPITRIGGGEVRVDRALAQRTIAWDAATLSAALSFGAVEADRQTVLERTLTLQNFDGTAKQFRIASSFRYADDAASNAVRVQAPSTVDVPANGTKTVRISLLINPTLLPEWTLNGGLRGGNGALLNGPEYDGYVTFTAGAEKVSVPWHVLPRRAAKLRAALARGAGSALQFVNTGAEAGQYDIFSLVGSSARLPGPLPGPGDNVALVDLKSVGVRFLPACGIAGGCVQFAASTWGRNAHPLYPRGIDFEVDTTGDGVADYIVFQQENGGFAATGQSVAFVRRVGTSSASAFFFTDADLNSGNVIYTVPLALLGSPPAGTTLTFDVFAYDNYFTGIVSESIRGMKFTPGSPRFSASGSPFGAVARGASAQVPFTSASVPAGMSSETGLLLMYRRNVDAESQEISLPTAP